MTFRSFFIGLLLISVGVGAGFLASRIHTDEAPTDAEEPHIGVTVMNLPDFPPSSETMGLSMDHVPFRVSVPDYWSFNEDEASYWVSYHEGLEGTLRFMKMPENEPLRDADPYETQDRRVHMRCTDRFCDITSDAFEGLYRVSLDTRSMSPVNSMKMERVLQSVTLDPQ